MKKILLFAVILVIVVAGVVFVPKLAHKCDDCGDFFVGAGYKPNIVSDLLNDEEQIICKDCAEKQHALSLAVGGDVEEFKRDLF
ncbi:MAG: hypothetical protein IKD04_09735 [Clostridia bacterium]|nr:hypothetical protein [Clostridia bacterium]